jgi:hypothetical protein
MDPIGGAASVITLLDLAIKTVKVVKNVTQSYVDAPSELFALQHEVDGLQIQLSLLGYVQESVRLDTLELCKVETETIARFIEQTLPLLSAICCQLETKILATGRTRRIKWALHDAAKVKEWEFSLQRRSSSLSNIILLLNLLVFVSSPRTTQCTLIVKQTVCQHLASWNERHPKQNFLKQMLSPTRSEAHHQISHSMETPYFWSRLDNSLNLARWRFGLLFKKRTCICLRNITYTTSTILPPSLLYRSETIPCFDVFLPFPDSWFGSHGQEYRP